jgi:phenylpropionate dioxygenase-like ring-hydroxylating dioxygenase large terminal subunit
MNVAEHNMTNLAVAQSDQAVRATLPRTLPAWVYNHAELNRIELERVLLPSWQIVCHINSIPVAGDFVTFDLGPESVIVLRDRDGSIRAFHNACRHRGARILDGAGHCAGPITCPYHGWSYRQDGSLVGVPVRESFPGLDRADFGLHPVRVDTAFGFVFVALRGDPAPVAKTWGSLLEEFTPYRTEEMVPLGPITVETWDVDWKIAMDNYLESYHVPIGHPGLNRMFTPDFEDQKAVATVARGVSWLREQESSRWSERLYQRLVGGIATHLPEKQRRSWRFYSALPNLGIDVFPEQMDFFQVLPSGPGQCVIRSGLFGLPDQRPEMRALRYLGNRINTQVNDEDRWLCKRVQRGLTSSSYQPGPLSQLEGWMLEFHNLLRERIPELRLSSAPKHFASMSASVNQVSA